MARPMYASFLPTIKCSSCGAELEISAMGDHLCSSSAEGVQTYHARTDHDRIPDHGLRPPEHLTINTAVHAPVNGRQISAPYHVEHAHSHQPLEVLQSPSPAPTPLSSSSSGPHYFNEPLLDPAKSSAPPRNNNESIMHTLQRPNSDLALPQDSPFPPFPTPKTIARNNAPGRLPLSDEHTAHAVTTDAPQDSMSPQSSSGANVLRRMNTITPGPFNSRGRREADKSGPLSPLATTAPGMVGFEPEAVVATSHATNQSPHPPSRSVTDDSWAEHLPNSTSNPSPLDVLPQPHSLPGKAEAESKSTASSQAMPEPSNRRGYSLTESESSVTSPSISEIRTESSRSSRSPLTSNASSETNRKPSVEHTMHVGHGIDSIVQGASSPIQARSMAEHSSIQDSAVDSQGGHAQTSELPEQSSAADSTKTRQASLSSTAQSSPAFSPKFPDGEQRLSSLRYDPNAGNGKASGPEVDFRQTKPKIRRPRTGPKGNCRGCATPITGKSLRAADGRLSGRWHRECLVCHTCRAPFQTADFYVLGDQPYCAHHYHVLNHSICQSCRTGIEGKFLEIQPAKKYHVECFTCQDCQKSLTKDYFEMNNLFYCEADAIRVWQKSKMLTPGRRFPERRTTKLMVTS